MEESNDLDVLLNSLPACRRCRSNKRRCDTLLPACRNCIKARTECIFFDHVLKEDLPRSYIASLLEALKQARPSHRVLENRTDRLRISRAIQGTSSHLISVPAPVQSGQSGRYFGPNSLLSQGLLTVGAQELPPEPQRNGAVFLEELTEDLVVKPSMHQFLLETYFSELHPLFPFLDTTLVFLSPQSPCSQELLPSEAFILHMVYSIACHCVPNSGNQLLSLSDACYARALNHIESATANVTVGSLQSITLLALRSLFDPQKGNFGQQVTFAARLAIDIGGQDIPAREETMKNIHTSIYCMESQFTAVLDRPPFLPEPTRPIEFDISQPSEFMCSLHRVQSRYRCGNEAAARNLMEMIDVDELGRRAKQDERIKPNLLGALYETQLLLNPVPAVASLLLATYHDARFIQTFLTPQWTYRAGLVVVQNKHGENAAEAVVRAEYAQAMVILDRASLRWKGARAMGASLEEYARAVG